MTIRILEEQGNRYINLDDLIAEIVHATLACQHPQMKLGFETLQESLVKLKMEKI